MNGRERLHAILNHQPVDRLSWTTLVDDVTRKDMPDEVRKLSTIEFYRSIGCDIVQFGNYGLGEEDAVTSPSRWQCRELVYEVETQEDGRPVRRRLDSGVVVGAGTAAGSAHMTIRRLSPWGTLTTVFDHDHPVEYPVKSLEDLRVLRAIWEASDYVEIPGMEASLARIERNIGADGMYVPTLDPSPVQYLLEYEMGVAGFYYLLEDHRQEVEELLAVMHARRLREYEILARRTSAEVVIPVENTSTTMISPEMYEKYSLPQIRDYVEVLHAHDKKAVLHMCGHLKDLLPVVKKTNLDGINAVTPPPVGDTYFEGILDAYGDDFTIFGGVLCPSVFHKLDLDLNELRTFLDRLYTSRLRRANLVLWVAVDGLTTQMERFLTVGQWMR